MSERRQLPADVTQRLLAQGWRIGKKRPRPTEARCWDCGVKVPHTPDPAEWLCDECRDKRRPV